MGPKNKIQPVTKHPSARLENPLLFKFENFAEIASPRTTTQKNTPQPHNHNPTLGTRHTHRLRENRRKKMLPCSMYGGCKNPAQDVGDHVCHTCKRPVHNLFLQALNGVGDHPERGFVCGRYQRCGLEQQPASGATPLSARKCAAGSKCTRGTKGLVNVKEAGWQGFCHLWCARLPCESCDWEDATDEGENNLNGVSE